MRLALCLVLSASPVAAWDFSANPVCTLTHEADATLTTVTYDPRRAEPYAIALSRDGGWPAGGVFAIRFAPSGPTISTTRHRVSGDTLTVSDYGFGNVLDGLQYNGTATAIAGDVSLTLDLSDAAAAVAAFRACTDGGIA